MIILSLGLATIQLNAMEEDTKTRYCQTIKCGWAFELQEPPLVSLWLTVQMLGQSAFGNSGIFSDPVATCPKCKRVINLIAARHHTEPINSAADLDKKFAASMQRLDTAMQQDREELDEEISNELRPFGRN